MNDDPPSPSSDPPPAPAEGGDRTPESWIERLRSALGRKAPSLREDIADALADEEEAGAFTPEERVMLGNILRLREVRVDDVMVPRADIEAVEVTVSLGALIADFHKSGHSRMPAYRGTLDDPVGFVHIKDVMGYLASAGEVPGGEGDKPAGISLDLSRVDLGRSLTDAGLVRNVLFVPPSMPVTALLAKMQATHMQLALVIDEYGGTDGLVSLEDVVEMVVGDIEDEHDDDAGPMIVPDGDGIFLADARADLEEVEAAIGADFGAVDDDEDYDTLGGLVFSLIGRIPVRGELVSAPGGFEFEILDADPRRIKRLRIYRRSAAPPRPEAKRRPRPAAETAPGEGTGGDG